MTGHLLRSWRSVRLHEALVFVSAVLMFGAINLSSLLELRVGEQLPQVLARQLLLPLVSHVVLLLCWLPASRSSATHPRRRLRLVAAMLLGSALAMSLNYALTAVLPWPSLCDLYAQAHGKPPCTTFRLTAVLGDALWAFMLALMIAGVLEFHTLRRRQARAAQDLLREHSQLRRQALGARLATLQAQVDPALLFDALVSVERAYGRHDLSASARLERLIHHLRLALPRLQRHHPSPPGGVTGATLGTEAELIASHLDLLRDLHGNAPAFDCELGAQSAVQLPPMLLLPLVQRALRLGPPTRCWLHAEGRITLGFDHAGLCTDDADLAAVRERLSVLGAQLTCTSRAGRTEFILELP